MRLATVPHPAVHSTSGSAEPGVELVPLAAIEKRHVLAVLAASESNRERAARVLQISRRTLSRMLQRWGLSSPRV